MFIDYKADKVWNVSRLAPGPGAVLTRPGAALAAFNTFEQADP